MKRSIRYLLLKAGNVLRRGKLFVLRLSGIEIGDGCFISFGAKFDMTRGRIIIGSNCTITHGCCLIAHDPTERRIYPGRTGEGTIVLEDNVYLGINVIVLKDVRISQHAIVGAGSVVTKDIPPYAVVVGNPGRIIKFWGKGADQGAVG